MIQRKFARKFGWKPQPDDSRDYGFERLVRAKRYQLADLPMVANNRYWCSSVEDQGDLGSCTANAWVGLLEYNENRFGRGANFYQELSRLFVYYNERVLEGTIYEDSGAQLRTGAKVLATQGVCREKLWPYKIRTFTEKPSTECYADGLANVIRSYYALQTLTDMKTCIANQQCFVFGFLVYASFVSQEMADTGILQMPKSNEEVLGGHAVLAVGYNDYEKRFLVKNSWGRNWGLKKNNAGYFTMPYEYITNWDLASDFWTVSKDT
jgi:C1A family cysteine protease